MNRFSVNISGSTIGAMAVGGGATAQASTGGSPPGPLRFSLEVRGATWAQIAKWLRAAADAVEVECVDTYAKTDGGTATSWKR